MFGINCGGAMSENLLTLLKVCAVLMIFSAPSNCIANLSLSDECHALLKQSPAALRNADQDLMRMCKVAADVLLQSQTAPEDQAIAPETTLNGHNMRLKRKNEFVRLGKRKNEFVRLGKRKNEFVRLGKRKNEFVRLGRSYFVNDIDDAIEHSSDSATNDFFNLPQKRKEEFIRLG